MTIKKFAGIVDGDVFTILSIDSTFEGIDGEAGERIIAGLQSAPIFVELPSDSGVTLDWTWDGVDFIPPAG
jgi:hypothetical protein